MDKELEAAKARVTALEAEKAEVRMNIARFLQDVWESATHGSSSLMMRAIEAVEADDMNNPMRIAVGADLKAAKEPR